jgi:hypothetical protein
MKKLHKNVKDPRKYLIKKCDELLSRYIRLSNEKDGRCSCASCGHPYSVEQMQCGHYQSRRYMATRFSIKNCAPQCARCNCWGATELTGVPGEPEALAKWLDQKWGEGTADLMKMESRRTAKFSILQLQIIRAELEQKLEDLG